MARAPLPSANRASRGATNRYLALALLSLVFVCNFLDRQILSVLNEPIKADLRLTDTQLGLLSGLAFAVFYTTLAIPVARLADRANRVRIVAAACAVWSVCCAACGLAGGFGQLAAARIGVGVGEAGGSPPSHSLISDFFAAGQRSSALSIYSLGTVVGPALGAAIGGWVAARFGWRMSFFAVGAPGLLLSLLLLGLLREPERGRLDDDRRAAEGAATLTSHVRLFFADPLLPVTALATGFAAFVGYGTASWLPAFLMRDKGMTLDQVAVAYASVSGVAGIVGTLGGGFIADRLAPRWPGAGALLPAACFLASAPFFGMALRADGWVLSLALLTPPLMLTSAFLAPALALVQDAVPASRRSISAALLLFCLNLVGLGGGPLFVGLVSDATAPAYGAASLGIGLAALLPFFLLTVVLYTWAGALAGRTGRLLPQAEAAS
jgi:predicted MFS family arabinose efflux permease